jgi:hypothetical protein
MEELAPEGVLQSVLAQRVVAAAWRLERAERLAAGTGLGPRSPTQRPRRLSSSSGMPTTTPISARAFDTLLRYRGGTLKALQAERHARSKCARPRARSDRTNPSAAATLTIPAGPAVRWTNPLATPPSPGCRPGRSRHPPHRRPVDRHPACNQLNPKRAESRLRRDHCGPRSGGRASALRCWPGRRSCRSAGPAGHSTWCQPSRRRPVWICAIMRSVAASPSAIASAARSNSSRPT